MELTLTILLPQVLCLPWALLDRNECLLCRRSVHEPALLARSRGISTKWSEPRRSKKAGTAAPT